MGATEFECTATGATAREAYDAAVEQAYYDYGHAGYTGTIAEKSGFIEITIAGNYAPSLAEAQEQAERLMSVDDSRVVDKWGPAGAIAYEDAALGKGWLFFGVAAC